MAVGGGGDLVSVFQGFSASIGKAFILAGALGTGLSLYLVYTMFISNNRPSFRLW